MAPNPRALPDPKPDMTEPTRPSGAARKTSAIEMDVDASGTGASIGASATGTAAIDSITEPITNSTTPAASATFNSSEPTVRPAVTTVL